MAAILVSKLSFRLHSQLLPFPGVKRSTAILCCKRRDHSSSSFPTRYIPKKKSSKVDEHQYTSSTEDRVSGSLDSDRRKAVLDKELKIQKKIYGRSVFLDNQHGSEAKINYDTKLIKREHVEDPKIAVGDVGFQCQRHDIKEKVPEDKAMLDAEKMAINFLAKRALTAVELAKKLQAKRVPHNIVGALITDFQSRGLINDSMYAETFSESRWSSLSWGPKRIKQALLKKGVSAADADKAVKTVFEDVECGSEASKLGMSKVSMDQLLVQTSKQWHKSETAPKETRKSRIIRWLQYRGFSWGVISFILRKLESQNAS